MRTLVIGDIHGCSLALEKLLEVVKPTSKDRIITLGDYVDRWPASRQVVDRILELRKRYQIISLRGNHEEMMLLSRHDPEQRDMWHRFGGKQTLESYGHKVTDDEYRKVPADHWNFLEKDLLDWYETENHIFVHATLTPDLPLGQQDRQQLLWDKLTEPLTHVSGKKIICGHTRQLCGLPLDLGTTVCIDTAVYELDGWLTCLDVNSGHFWQANQRKDSRQAELADLSWLRG
ncbi:MAG: metallophosphoesterase family protein [Gemmataceae bacterium]